MMQVLTGTSHHADAEWNVTMMQMLTGMSHDADADWDVT